MGILAVLGVNEASSLALRMEPSAACWGSVRCRAAGRAADRALARLPGWQEDIGSQQVSDLRISDRAG
jgi:hypothetical protein